jgi:hypothetical protein
MRVNWDSVVRFAIPFVLAGAVAAGIYLAGPSIYERSAAEVAVFFGAVGTGAVTAIITGVALGLHPLYAALLVAFMESDMSLFISLNFNIILDIPVIGNVVKKYMEKARRIIQMRRFVEGMELVAIYTIMFIPFYGTGAITMTLVGKILGLDWRKVWLTVTLASLTRSLLVAYLTYAGMLTLS